MANTLAVKANGQTAMLLTSEYDSNWWPSLDVASGIFTNTNQISAVVRSGSGFLRANAVLSAPWASEERKTICTLPEGARPEFNVGELVHSGRFYLYIGTDGTVTMQNKAGAALAANSAAEFCVAYPLKVVGGGLKTTLKGLFKKLFCFAEVSHGAECESKWRQAYPGRIFRSPEMSHADSFMDNESWNAKHQRLVNDASGIRRSGGHHDGSCRRVLKHSVTGHSNVDTERNESHTGNRDRIHQIVKSGCELPADCLVQVSLGGAA